MIGLHTGRDSTDLDDKHLLERRWDYTESTEGSLGKEYYFSINPGKEYYFSDFLHRGKYKGMG